MKLIFLVLAATIGLLALLTHQGTVALEKRFPPSGKFVEIDGVRLHYKEGGSGPTIVLIHGASTSLLDFDASLSKPLSANHRVIAVDRPGHGYSERPSGKWPDPADQAKLIHGLLQHLNVDQPTLVGHSWAGSVVLAYLLTYPEHSRGGVLLAGGSHPWQGGTAWYNELATMPLLGALFARTLVYPIGLLLLDKAVESVFAPNPVPADYVESTGVELSLRPATFIANAEDISRLSTFLADQQHHYDRIEHPLLLITGTDDDVVPAWNHADRLLTQAARAEKVSLERTGHAMHHSHPERVAALVSDFTERHRQRARQLEALK